MKKLLFLAVCVAAISFASCGNSTEPSVVVTDSDSVAVDTVQVDTFGLDSVCLD